MPIKVSPKQDETKNQFMKRCMHKEEVKKAAQKKARQSNASQQDVMIAICASRYQKGQ